MKTKLVALLIGIALVLVLSACGGAAATPAPAAGDATAAPAASDATAAPAAGDVVAKFDFSNVGTVDICQLFLSHVSKNEWGPDQLQGQTIPAGGKFTLTNIPAGTYDAKWVGCDKTEGTLQIDIKN
jgi:hypothetical protein